ncbi:hypothetical protein THOE12_50099 [Vibrio rotiferianus]|nr:hypothetical protein THOE12_50099 [Vibrio rotiferianus]
MPFAFWNASIYPCARGAFKRANGITPLQWKKANQLSS